LVLAQTDQEAADMFIEYYNKTEDLNKLLISEL